ncbi:MAG: hypothetical protein H6659_11685 [Ardenticatenaceae bacterium]|nr:hypothetical protein [Ardenticatenaceae bacterium]
MAELTRHDVILLVGVADAAARLTGIDLSGLDLSGLERITAVDQEQQA